MMTLSGLRQPELSGMSASTKVRKTYSTAAMHTADGALKLFGSCAEVPVKSIVALRRLLGIVLHVPHVCLHDFKAELLDHPAELLHALFVCRDLGAQIGDVL